MSYHSLLYHIIFRPYKNIPAITEEYERDLYYYIYMYVKRKEKDCVVYRIGGMPDHIHMLVSLTPKLAIADFMRNLKTALYFFMNNNKERFPLFQGWGESYAVLSYSLSQKEIIINYIKNQKEHHKRVSFHDELRTLLEEQGIEFDEKYFLK